MRRWWCGLLVLWNILRISFSQDVCRQTGPCSCTNSKGKIDLSPLASTSADPKFKDIQEDTGSDMFSYNPCNDFSEGDSGCVGVAACQILSGDPILYFSLGPQTSAKFVTSPDSSVHVEYSADTENFLRTAEVKLVCDESVEGKMDIAGETPTESGIFLMTLTSKYACPKRSTPATPTPTPAEECMQTGPCSCQNSKGTLDLTPLTSATTDAKFKNVKETVGDIMFSYNPCLDFNQGSCLGVAACAIQPTDPETYINLGSQASSKFVTDSAGNIQMEYHADTENFQRTSMVKLVCDEQMEFEFDATGETPPASGIFVMTLRSKYACLMDSTRSTAPGTPTTTPSTPQETCAKTGPCSCTSSRGIIDLTPLASITKDAKFKNVGANLEHEMFSYNPCNNFNEGTCVGVAACYIQPGDPEIYVSLGSQESAKFVTNPDGSTRLEYIADAGSFLRAAHVYLICDEATEFKFVANGEIPVSSGIYAMTLTSKYICPKGSTLPSHTTSMEPPFSFPGTPTTAPLDACRQTGPCSCINSKGTIDLSPLASITTNAKFLDVLAHTGINEISYNPCNDFTEGTCVDVAACEIHPGSPNSYFSLGSQASAEFETNIGGSVQVTYRASSVTTPRSVQIKLLCDEGTESKLDVIGEIPTSSGFYFMTMTSKYACPR